MPSNGEGQAADIIVPVHDQVGRTRKLLDGIYSHTDLPFHLYVIDNASTDATAELDRAYTRDLTLVRNQENRGWCGAINQGIGMGGSRYVVFMNNDVEVSRHWLGNLVAFLETHPRIGAVGPLASNPRDWQCIDRVRTSMVPELPRFTTEDLHERNRILRYRFHRAGILVEGMLAFFCTAFKRRTVELIGPLDESFVGGGDDDDYCRRLRKAGFVLGLSLETYVLHHSGSTHESVYSEARRRELRKANLARLKSKHPEYF